MENNMRAATLYTLILIITFYNTDAHPKELFFEYSAVYYTNLSNKPGHVKETIALFNNGEQNQPGLIGAPFGACENSNWICSFSLNLNFAIPKNWESNTKEWKHKGYTHKLINNIELEFFGTKISAHVIHVISDYPQTDNYIFYSKKYGIIGFTVFYANQQGEDPTPLTFISSSKYAYGSKN